MAKRRGNKPGLHKSRSRGFEPKRLTSDELLFQPWFLSKRVQSAVRSLVPPSFRTRMRDFFDDYGCMICSSDERYEANGMCLRCNQKVRGMIEASARRRLKTTLARRLNPDLLRPARIAKRLLRNFSPKSCAASPIHRITGIRPSNPVDEMLGPHRE
jgi:hypothetical protein